MSTVANAALTSKREEAAPGTSTSSSPPGTRTYVDALAALVPAEVLTAHAVILSFTTETHDVGGQSTIVITAPGTLKAVFFALIGLSMLIYFVARIKDKRWDRLDYARMLVPAAAFVGWTMLQKATAFDAVAPDLSQAPRNAIAIIGAIVLGIVAAALAYQADQKAR